MDQKKHQTVIETIIHIHKVQRLLAVAISSLHERMINHDRSKILSEELDGFAGLEKEISNIEFGSQEYYDQLEILNGTLAHHYKENAHHPEHFADGINGMSLIDVLEMVIDWIAAADRSKNGNIMRSLPFEKQRYNIDDQLYQIIRNTVLYLEGK